MASMMRLSAGLRCMGVVRYYPRSNWVVHLRDDFHGKQRLRWQSTATAAAPLPESTAGASFVQKRKGPEPEPDAESEGLAFSSLKGRISYDTLKAITVSPFKMTRMTPVQAQVLPLLPELAEPYDPTASTLEPDAPRMRGPRDLLVKARTGTGKTLAFLVPAIEARLKAIEAVGKQAVRDAGLKSDKALEARVRRRFAREEVGTLIVSPTRELATQIANEAMRLLHHHPDMEVRLFVGGESKGPQMRGWMRGRRDIVVVTPGRLLDLLNSDPEMKHGISKTRILILDEADTLLALGFRDDIEQIKEFLPQNPERQNFLFSATISREIQQIARSTLNKDFAFINTVSDTDVPVHVSVPQYHTVLPSAEEQIPHLLRLIAHDQLTNPGKSKVLVFLPTTKMTQLFATILRELRADALPTRNDTRVFEIHSKRSQDQRSRVSDAFRNDKTGATVLVSSDVSARGVDYPGITRVIQVGIPAGTEQYIHRIGRTGRAGTTGGRGDLVLLPWEHGFVRWQLDGIPLKPLPSHELTSQLKTLANAYDEDPVAAFKNVKTIQPGVRVLRKDAGKPRMFAAPLSQNMEDISSAVEKFLPSLDEEAVKETFVSLLGFYVARTSELRAQKGVIVQGCKDWTTGACGLSVPPYVSDEFLQRIGFSEQNLKRSYGREYGRGRGSDRRSSSAPWAGRGSNRAKDRRPRFSDYSNNDDDVDFSRGEYGAGRGDGYGSRARSGSFSSFRSPSSSEYGGYDGRGRSSGGESHRGGGRGRAFGIREK